MEGGRITSDRLTRSRKKRMATYRFHLRIRRLRAACRGKRGRSSTTPPGKRTFSRSDHGATRTASRDPTERREAFELVTNQTRRQNSRMSWIVQETSFHPVEKIETANTTGKTTDNRPGRREPQTNTALKAAMPWLLLKPEQQAALAGLPAEEKRIFAANQLEIEAHKANQRPKPSILCRPEKPHKNNENDKKSGEKANEGQPPITEPATPTHQQQSLYDNRLTSLALPDELPNLQDLERQNRQRRRRKKLEEIIEEPEKFKIWKKAKRLLERMRRRAN